MLHKHKQATTVASGQSVQPKGHQNQRHFSKVTNISCGQRPQLYRGHKNGLLDDICDISE